MSRRAVARLLWINVMREAGMTQDTEGQLLELIIRISNVRRARWLLINSPCMVSVSRGLFSPTFHRRYLSIPVFLVLTSSEVRRHVNAEDYFPCGISYYFSFFSLATSRGCSLYLKL